MANVIITGSTGMVGKGVLLECLEAPDIKYILVINRNPINLKHPKLKEIILGDFTLIEEKRESLKGYDACFFCMGVSSVGLSEEAFFNLTYKPVKAFADLLYSINQNLIFNYVSGTGTDSTEKGNTMWARVKGKTENEILYKGFKDAYAFRPGMIIPEKGIQSKTRLYNAIYIVLKPFFPLLAKSKNITTTSKLGKAMINTLRFPIANKFLENKDINQLSAMA